MLLKRIYIFFTLLYLSIGIILADTFGFVAVGSNYYKSVSEATDGTIQISVTDEGATGTSINFQLHVDYTTNPSTAEHKDYGSGSGYYRDWHPGNVSWTSNDA